MSSRRGLYRPNERETTRIVLGYLKTLEIHPERRNVGGMKYEYKGKKGYVEFARTGQSDWWYLLPDGSGRHGELEIKRPGAWPTDFQIHWMLTINAAGGLACWVDSLAIAQRAFQSIMKGLSIYMRESGEYSFTDMHDGCRRWNLRELTALSRRILKAGGRLP
jgi:hypothetical protein